MNQKILTRIATVAEKDEDLIIDDSVIVCLTLDQHIRDSLFRASNQICELEHSDIRNNPVSVDINVDALVYQDHDMDEDLRDHLWNEYEGVAVDEFPVINEESIGNRVRLTVSRPVDKALQPDDCCVWLSFDGSMGLYAAPVRFLGNTVEHLFNPLECLAL